MIYRRFRILLLVGVISALFFWIFAAVAVGRYDPLFWLSVAIIFGTTIVTFRASTRVTRRRESLSHYVNFNPVRSVASLLGLYEAEAGYRKENISTETAIAYLRELVELGKQTESQISELRQAFRSVESNMRYLVDIQATLSKKAEAFRVQNNLDQALRRYVELTGDPEIAREAIVAIRHSLEVLSRSDTPLEWATAQNNLGNALLRYAELTADRQVMKEATQAFQSALEVLHNSKGRAEK